MVRPRLTITRIAHNRALHFLTRPDTYRLSDLVRHQLTQVLEGYVGKCDEDAARRGLDWMRNEERVKGRTPTF